jgi:SAM-dependent methyltransferase
VILWFLAAIVLLFGFVVFWGAPYVPSHRGDVRKAFDELYMLGEKDFVVDVGSGDGIILRMASSRGARAIGYELNPALVMITRFLSRKDGNVRVVLADFWRAKLPSETTLIYAFAVERDIKKLSIKLQAEADRLDRSFYVITYGSSFTSPTPLRTLGAHYLYEFHPLHSGKPQV